MKRLFSEDKQETYTEEALALSLKAKTVLEPLIAEWSNMGFSIRDIEYVLHSEVLELCLMSIIGWNTEVKPT